MSFVFKLDMCTCGGKRVSIISFDLLQNRKIERKKKKKSSFNNSFVFLRESAFEKVFSKFSRPNKKNEKYDKSLSLFDTDFLSKK